MMKSQERSFTGPLPVGSGLAKGYPRAVSSTPEERREKLIAVYREMCDAHACPLIASRTKLVFGAGNADADLMFVGEAPGANEDLQGLPFVGRAGKLLDELLAEVGLARGDVFVTNVICCRPPGNRDPLPEEIEACKPYLHRKIELIEPKVICTLGNFATKLLTGNPTGITKVHGRPQEREVANRLIKLFPIFHPAAALRTDSIKQLLRGDFAKLPELLAVPADEPEEAGAAEQLGLFQ
jgi:uracil-DNA glycosylase family 4